MTSLAQIHLWGRHVASVLWSAERGLGTFEYTQPFIRSRIELAPFTLPLAAGVYDFPSLPRETFHGLPGLLSDSLPDRFGNLLINRWLAEQGRSPDSMDPVERLLYTGKRGMGALEFEPADGPQRGPGTTVDIAPLVELANRVLAERQSLAGVIDGKDDKAALTELLRVGTSAGGARAKAVLAWNETTGEFHSGQLLAGPGFTQWLMKFDGVSASGDHGLSDPKGFTRLEYACYLLATAAGVEMMPSRLHHEGGRAHFMTRRFDRVPAANGGDGEKLHMLSLGGMRHFDFNAPQAYSYEQALDTARRLDLGNAALEQIVRRAIVNVVIRNQDDHVRNLSFLMDKSGAWRLAPAYDVVYAYNPAGNWTSQHQMTISGKADNFTPDDLVQFGKMADLKPKRTLDILEEVASLARQWDIYASQAGVPEDLSERARKMFRFV